MARTTASKPAARKTAAPAKKTAAKTAVPAKKSAVVAKAPASKPNGANKPAAPVPPVVSALPKPLPKPLPNPALKPAPKPESKPEAKEKAKKIKLVRDSFTMPESEYAVLGEVKKACLKAGIEVKKSELLRVGVALIRQLDTAKLKEILNGLPTLKAGRPKKSK